MWLRLPCLCMYGTARTQLRAVGGYFSLPPWVNNPFSKYVCMYVCSDYYLYYSNLFYRSLTKLFGSNVLMFLCSSILQSILQLFVVYIRMKVFMIFTDPSSTVFCSFFINGLYVASSSPSFFRFCSRDLGIAPRHPVRTGMI